MPRSVNPVPQYLGDDGNPLAFGKMFYFESGSATLKDLFSDEDLSIPASNPRILTGSGRLPNTFYSGSVRQKLTDKDEVQFFDVDPVTSGTSGGAFEDWNSVRTYNIPDYVIGSDNNIYRSSINANENNDPVSSSTAWEQVEFIGIFNLNITYAANDIVKGSDGNLYRSLAGSNIGNDPTSTAAWTAAVDITGTDLALTQATALSF